MLNKRIVSLEELCQGTSVKFGTSGLRGLVADLSEEICRGFTQAFLKTLCQGSQTLVIGMDLRPSSQQLKDDILKEATSLGVSIIDCGIIPTPALAFFAQHQNLPAIMVTGSHIPFNRNGLKFYTAHGEITKQDEERLLSVSFQVSNINTKEIHRVDISDQHLKAQQAYLDRYKIGFKSLDLTNKRIGVYQHSSVSRDLLVELLRHFNADVIPLGRTDQFVPIDTEAVSEEDQQQALKWSKAHKLDAIVSTDGDGDRPLITDETGQWLRGDIVGLLTCQHLQATHIATPLNSNTSLERALPDTTIKRTKIGSPYVIEALEELNNKGTKEFNEEIKKVVIGYEANGGVILKSNVGKLKRLETRDAVLPILCCLSLAQSYSLSAVVTNASLRHTASERIKDIPLAHSLTLIEKLATKTEIRTKLLNELHVVHNTGIDNINLLDSLRITFSNQETIHLRASGNADELRCYAESNSSERSLELCKKTLEYISHMVKSKI